MLLILQKELRQALAPYLALTQAVRNGDLIEFAQVTETFKPAFLADKNYTLVQRLRHNVRICIFFIYFNFTRNSHVLMKSLFDFDHLFSFFKNQEYLF